MATVTAPRISKTVRWAWIGCGIGTALAWGLTWVLSRSMAGDMVMPGGWRMSMMWMPMAGQPEWYAAVMFLLMWECMMVAMMLLSALPVFLLVQRVIRRRGDPAIWSVLVALGYFVSWLLFGSAVYGLGRGFTVMAMRWQELSQAVPILAGAAVIGAGLYQLTPWKALCLKHCRDPLSLVAEHWRASRLGAFRTGFHHGNYCVACCWGLMAIQCILGVMSLPLMLAVATLIGAEKLLPRGQTIAAVAGVLSMLAGGMILAGWLSL